MPDLTKLVDDLSALTVLTAAEDVGAPAGVVAAGAFAITGAVSMEAAMSAMATLRNMEIAFRGRFAWRTG